MSTTLQIARTRFHDHARRFSGDGIVHRGSVLSPTLAAELAEADPASVMEVDSDALIAVVDCEYRAQCGNTANTSRGSLVGVDFSPCEASLRKLIERGIVRRVSEQ